MNTTRSFVAFGLAATFAINGCCGGDEQHSVTVSAPDSLVVTRDGATRRVEVVTQLTETQVRSPTFQFVFNTIEGSTSGEGIALTLSGNDPVSDELFLLVLALPVSLRDGDQYPIGATFNVEPGGSDPQMWGAHDLQQSNQADVAFTVATYRFPPGVYDATFRAATSTGTIRVTERERGRVELSLNLSLADAAGKTTTVTGRAQANTGSFTLVCG
jgi:hypothetical protein